MHTPIAFVAVLAAGSAMAKIIQIDAGKSGLVFSPDTSTADVGDTLEFHFYSAFHTAVQGDFSTPCKHSSSGFNSGPMNNKADGTPNVFQVLITDTNPIWYYCSTPSHCQSGMAGVINPPSSSGGNNTLASYKSAAAGTSSSDASSSVSGGQVVAVGTQPSSAAPPGSSSSSSAASASSSAASSVSSATAASSSAAVSTSSSAAASSAASATPTKSAASGALSPHGSVVAAQGTFVGLAVGLGLLGFLML